MHLLGMELRKNLDNNGAECNSFHSFESFKEHAFLKKYKKLLILKKHIMNIQLRNVPFSPPDMTNAEANEVRDAILSGWITTGPRTKRLEKKSPSMYTRKKLYV